MPDDDPMIYDAEPHTVAKHRILREYLKRWLVILARQSQKLGRRNERLLYVDGFAGAGEYAGGDIGSPLIAIDEAMALAGIVTTPIEIRLIELREDRAAHLTGLVSQRRQRADRTGQIILRDPICGDCQSEINRILDQVDANGSVLGPAFFFLDQFGYSSFSMRLLGRILKHDLCEVFSYLNWNRLCQFMSDTTKHTGITEAFGGEEWREVLTMSGKQKENRFRDIYIDALHSRGNAAYPYPFAMRDKNDRVIYWLFFSTNNLTGLEEMKEAMWSVDRSGGFEFSDKFANELGPMFKYNQESLARNLVSDLAGQEVSIGELRKHALVNTPAHKYYNAFQLMERVGQLKAIDPPAKRRAGSFKEFQEMRVLIRRIDPIDSQSLFDEGD